MCELDSEIGRVANLGMHVKMEKNSMTTYIITSLLWVLVTSSHYALMVIASSKVPAVIVFGDSSVDAGNNNKIATVLKSNFRPYGRDFDGGHPTGRFCNGRIPPDFIAEAFGVKSSIPAYLDPMFSIQDFATGVCFASAGTGYDNKTSDVLVSLFFFFWVETNKSLLISIIYCFFFKGNSV